MLSGFWIITGNKGKHNMKKYDRIIIGAGLYGLYAALYCGKRGERILVLEKDARSFGRATYINQARVHMGYHYPRSLTTAVKSADYFNRFVEDYGFCIHQEFEQIYAISKQFSWTNGVQFVEFCRAAGIPCEEVPASRYFKEGMCEGAYLTQEYTYDARILQDFYMEQLTVLDNVDFIFEADIMRIIKGDKTYEVLMADGEKVVSEFVLNATYASTNQILTKVEGMDTEQFDIKYELCEIILCKPSEELKDVGITVMDGPFFSVMPFGKTGYHSLTSVTFTPHVTSHERLPLFRCQQGTDCSADQLANCNTCKNKPDSAWPYMSHLADKYMKEKYAYQYIDSLFSMKPILKTSEVDDSRPTAIKVLSTQPAFVSVLSGKINTVYDLDEYLQGV